MTKSPSCTLPPFQDPIGKSCHSELDDHLHLSQPCNLGSSSLPPLTAQQAKQLASQMRQGLQAYTKDRVYRFRSYKSCFQHSRALCWALSHIDSDERIAVARLNQLVDWGFVRHVVDPEKRFRIGEKRRMYFRIIEDSINQPIGQECSQMPKATEIYSTNSENNTNAIINQKLEAMQSKLEGLDHILQQTVQELNTANGKLEIMHQQVYTLVSQHISIFFMVYVLYVYNILGWVSSYTNAWFSLTGFVASFSVILLGKWTWECICMWNLLGNRMIPSSILPTTTLCGADGGEESVMEDESVVSIKGEENGDESKEFSRRNFYVYESQQSMKEIIAKPIEWIFKSSSKSYAQDFADARSSRYSSFRGTQRDNSILALRQPKSLPDLDMWPHRPLLICVGTSSTSLKVPRHDHGPCPIGRPFQFSSDLFEGTCLIRIKGCAKSDDPVGDAKYFSGRKRIFQSVVQGRFKVDGLRVSDVMTGHEFSRPLKNLPHPWILKTASNFIEKVAPGSNLVIHAEQPFMETILAGTSQVVRGDEPGNEPNITSCNIEEDCSIFGGIFSKSNGLNDSNCNSGDVSISHRKRLFSNPEKCNKYKFDTETIYTFEFYQNLFDVNSYALDLGFTKVGCSKILNGQPIQWLGKLRDGRYLWSFQVWHEKLLLSDG